MLPNELPAFQSHVHTLLADGNTRQAVADLLAWTKTYRPRLRSFGGQAEYWHREALLLSADFEKMSRDESRGVLSFEQLNLNRSQINDRLLQLTDRLGDAPPSAATYFLKKHWGKVVAVPVALGVLASVAEISGYNVASFFKKEPPPIVQPDTLNKPTQAIEQTTHGDKSPAVKTESGDVNIQYDGDDWEKAAEKKKK